MIDYKIELNDEQREAVLGAEGPCLVLAGAGSGKTRVITYRAAYLLEKGVVPGNILLVTFTNKAAAEMVNRIQKLTGSEARLPWAGTFHHIANKILRIYAPLLGFRNNFTVLDSDDSETLIKLCSKNFHRREAGSRCGGDKNDGPGQRFPSASVLQNIISYSRNAEKTVEDVLDMKHPHWMPWAPQIVSIAADYERKKREANAMDFDDLLTNFLLLLNDEKVLNKYAGQFQYILVDEYQDTNRAQASIIKKLSSSHGNVLAVGDDAQSIYSFRAADVENILNFEKNYPAAKIFRLETNYRSTKEILDLANNVIANNVKQHKKRLRTTKESGVKPILSPSMDQAAEAEFVAQKIEEALDKNTPANEVAVLFRAASHSQMLEMELMRRGIAYDYRGGVRFFERAHVKDILSYLRIINNMADTAAWLRVLIKEEGIGHIGAQKIAQNIKNVQNVEDVKSIGFEMLGEKARSGWGRFVNIWERLIGASKKPAEMIFAAVESGYKDFVEAEYLDFKDRLADLRSLAEFAKKYETLDEFLSEAALQEGFRGNHLSAGAFASPPARGGDKEGVGVKEKIILSTIHQAKGLEWEKVFLINLSSSGFPNERALREDGGLEEERRLFYVAITRAKNDLFITYPMSGGFSAQGRSSSGWGDSLFGPSMFLSEISEGLVDDKSLLSTRHVTVYNDDEDEEIKYVSEDRPKIKPGPPSFRQGRNFGEVKSFLRDVDEL